MDDDRSYIDEMEEAIDAPAPLGPGEHDTVREGYVMYDIASQIDKDNSFADVILEKIGGKTRDELIDWAEKYIDDIAPY
jgi:hypothetical protein